MWSVPSHPGGRIPRFERPLPPAGHGRIAQGPGSPPGAWPLTMSAPQGDRGGGRLDAAFGDQAPRGDGRVERLEVALVLVRVRGGEVRDRVLEHVRPAQVGGNRDLVA